MVITTFAAFVLLDYVLRLRAPSQEPWIEPLRPAGCKTFVALTGHDDTETAERCRAAGCADVLVKPVPARELISKVAGWLSS